MPRIPIKSIRETVPDRLIVPSLANRVKQKPPQRKPSGAKHGSRLAVEIFLIEHVRPLVYLELPLHHVDQNLLFYSPICSISPSHPIKYGRGTQFLTENMHILQFIPYLALIPFAAAVAVRKTPQGVQGGLDLRPSTPWLERKPVQLAPDEARPQSWFPSQVGEGSFAE